NFACQLPLCAEHRHQGAAVGVEDRLMDGGGVVVEVFVEGEQVIEGELVEQAGCVGAGHGCLLVAGDASSLLRRILPVNREFTLARLFSCSPDPPAWPAPGPGGCSPAREPA